MEKEIIKEEDLYSNVVRVEVIDENGRSYVNWDKNNLVKLDLQDNQKTLKIFISKKNTNDEKL